MARNFDGTDDEINCGSNAVIDDLAMGQITVSAWIRPDTLGTSNVGRIASKRSTGGWIFRLHTSNRLRVSILHVGGSGSAITDSVNNTITLNEWQHVAFTYDNDDGVRDVEIYHDGSEVSYALQPTVPDTDKIDASESLMIGNVSGGVADRFFDGDIAEVAIWNDILSAHDISQLYTGKNPRRIRPYALVAYPRLDGVESPEPDLSGNRNNGTVTGAIRSDHPPVGRFRNPLRFIPSMSIAAPTGGINAGSLALSGVGI